MATSTAQTVATVPVYDYLMNPGDATLTSAPSLAGKRVKVSLAYDRARSTSPVTWVTGGTIYSTLTDQNGFWQVNVVPTDQITPSGTYYVVEVEGYLSYKINPTLAGLPGPGWQSSAILVDIPATLAAVAQTIGALTVTGLLAVGPGEPGIDTSSAGALLIGDNAATSIELGAATNVPSLAVGYGGTADAGSLNNDYMVPPPSGAAATDTSNITTALNAALGAGSGRVILQRTKPNAPYLLNAALPTISKPGVALVGPGAGACQIQPTAAVTGDCIRVQLASFTVTPTGLVLQGFTVDGTNAGAGATGIHYGDIVGGLVSDVIAKNFSGAGSKAWWLDNRTNWTEETVFLNCAGLLSTINLLLDVNGGTNSFGYTSFLHFRVQVNAAQTGIQVQNGAHLYSGCMFVRGNSGGAGSWVIRILDTALIGGPGGAGGAMLFNVNVETTGVGSPGGLQIAAGASLCGTGVIDLSIGGSTSANAGTQNIQFGGYFNCAGIFAGVTEGTVTHGLSVLQGPNYPVGPGLWSDNNSLFAFSKAGSSVTLRPNGPSSAFNQLVGNGGLWQSYDGAGGVRNSLDDSFGGMTAKARVMSGTTAPAYSASITPDARAGNWQTITVANNTAFTINAPTNPPAATATEVLVIEIFNNSGGAMGVITWNAALILVGGAFTNPASTKRRFIWFGWNGANWIEVARASADY